MPITRKIGGLAFGALLLAACTPGANDPFIGAPPQGTVQRDLRAAQAQSALGDPNRAQQNPAVITANPGVGGIERAPTGGSGGTGAGTPAGAVNPGVGGIERGPGVGAPNTQEAPPSQPRRTRRTTKPSTTTPASGSTSGTTSSGTTRTTN